MNSELVLLKIVKELNPLVGRKRLQKILYLLKEKEFPLEERFFMHFYGPYSSGISLILDSLVNNGLINEKFNKAVANQYSYSITENGEKKLALFYKNSTRQDKNILENSLKIVRNLNSRKVIELEIAATILYWEKNGYSAEESKEITIKQKRPKTIALLKAISLLKELSVA